MSAKESQIRINVELDDNNIPEKLFWEASDGGQELSECKAAFLSFWDNKSKDTLRIDLWTKEMMAEEMKFFTFQIIDTLAETYKRSVGDEKLAKEIKDFAINIGKKSKVLK